MTRHPAGCFGHNWCFAATTGLGETPREFALTEHYDTHGLLNPHLVPT
jgi:hypothetical protein